MSAEPDGDPASPAEPPHAAPRFPPRLCCPGAGADPRGQRVLKAMNESPAAADQSLSDPRRHSVLTAARRDHGKFSPSVSGRRAQSCSGSSEVALKPHCRPRALNQTAGSDNGRCLFCQNTSLFCVFSSSFPGEEGESEASDVKC